MNATEIGRLSHRVRIERACIPEPNTGCWLWMQAIAGGGYGAIGVHGKVKRAHRVSYECFVGAIPAGMVIDHMCRTRSCVNPDHLRVVTLGINAVENSFSSAAINKQKLVCPKCSGDYVTMMLYTGKRGRQCPKCYRDNYNRKNHLRGLRRAAIRHKKGVQ